MSAPARYENGVFRPLEEVKSAAHGEVYCVFSEQEVHGLRDEVDVKRIRAKAGMSQAEFARALPSR